MTVRSIAWLLTIVSVVSTMSLAIGGQTPAEKLKDPSQLTEQAPAAFRARFDTTQGAFVIAVEREWAPLAADRFYNLVKNGFYDESRFFRVLAGFMAQFGLNGNPAVDSAWRTANLKDEPVKKSNTRGFVTFTRESGPNSRYTMIFVNYKDNSYLDADGFAPFGEVVSGMEVVDKLYSEYGRQNVPDQRRIVRDGNAYLTAEYPKLDYVKTATIESAPARPAAAASRPQSPTAVNRSVPAGVYTRAQAARGQAAYELRCAHCHGAELGGDIGEAIPALAWEPFFLQWNGRTVAELAELIARSMPPDEPGSTNSREATELVSYILQVNGLPDGASELPSAPESQAHIAIERP